MAPFLSNAKTSNLVDVVLWQKFLQRCNIGIPRRLNDGCF